MLVKIIEEYTIRKLPVASPGFNTASCYHWIEIASDKEVLFTYVYTDYFKNTRFLGTYYNTNRAIVHPNLSKAINKAVFDMANQMIDLIKKRNVPKRKKPKKKKVKI